jgi:hypothetical protein
VFLGPCRKGAQHRISVFKTMSLADTPGRIAIRLLQHDLRCEWTWIESQGLHEVAVL